MKKFILSVVITTLAFLGNAQSLTTPIPVCSDLFFSELTFGKAPKGGNVFDLNYAVEIFNASASTMNLSSYSLELSNSAGTVTSIQLSGMLASHEVYVVSNSNADLNLQGLADHLTSDLDFENNVTLELKKGNILKDKLGIGGNSLPQTFDFAAFNADPYNYLLNYHLDLNDYQNIDIRRSILAQHGNPNFNASTDVLGEWWYTPNVDRSDIGFYTCSCNKPIGIDYIGYQVGFRYIILNQSGDVDPLDLNVNNSINAPLTSGSVNLTHTEDITTSTTDICNDGSIPNAGMKFDPATPGASSSCQSLTYAYSTGGNSGTNVQRTSFAVSGEFCDLKLSIPPSPAVQVDPAKKLHTTQFNIFVATKDIAKNKFNVYPTAVENIINIDHTEALDYYITDMLGNKLQHGKIEATQSKIEISNFAKGFYMLTLVNKNSMSNYKFIKL
jgi:hypothetical protein